MVSGPFILIRNEISLFFSVLGFGNRKRKCQIPPFYLKPQNRGIFLFSSIHSEKMKLCFSEYVYLNAVNSLKFPPKTLKIPEPCPSLRYPWLRGLWEGQVSRSRASPMFSSTMPSWWPMWQDLLRFSPQPQVYRHGLLPWASLGLLEASAILEGGECGEEMGGKGRETEKVKEEERGGKVGKKRKQLETEG